MKVFNSTILLLVLAIVPVSLEAQIVNIPNPAFKDILVNRNVLDTDGDFIPDSDVDLNNDGEIQVSEAEAPTLLDITGFGLTDIEGIAAFTSLTFLRCGQNKLDSLENLPQSITTLEVNENGMVHIDLSNNQALTFLYAPENNFKTLDLSPLDKIFSCYVPLNPELEFLNVKNGNFITSSCDRDILGIDLCPKLKYICCNENDIECVKQIAAETNQTDILCNTDCDGSDIISTTHELGNNTILIYPNPTNNFIKIETYSPLDYRINLYDLTGQLLQSQQNGSMLNLSSFSEGLYLLEVFNKMDGKRVIEKIIVKK